MQLGKQLSSLMGMDIRINETQPAQNLQFGQWLQLLQFLKLMVLGTFKAGEPSSLVCGYWRPNQRVKKQVKCIDQSQEAKHVHYEKHISIGWRSLLV